MMTRVDEINEYFNSLNDELAAVGISLVNGNDSTESHPLPANNKATVLSNHTLKIIWDISSCPLGLKSTFQQIIWFFSSGSIGLKYTFQQIIESPNEDQIKFIGEKLLNVRLPIYEVNLEGIKSRNLIELILSIKSLQSLNLSDNNLRSLPSSIIHLTNLTKLNLSKNNLKIVPPQIQILPNLEELDLSWNHISSYPDSSSFLPKLKSLKLTGNLLRHWPSGLISHRQLEELHINFNDLIDISQDISKLTSLKLLDLSGNHLEKIPHEIEYLHNLTTLNLSRNLLRALPLQVFKLKNLNKLDASENNLTHIPEIFEVNRKLTTLILSQNMIKNLPENIGNLQCLKELDLSDNEISEYIDKLVNNTNLENLNLSGNCIKDRYEFVFNLSNLHTLDISENEIETLPEISLIPPSKLNNLNLSANIISELPERIWSLHSLKIINISHNYIKNLNIPDTIYDNNIVTLNLSSNPLKFLPDEIKQLQSLKHLDLSGNDLTELPDTFSQLVNLETLNLSDNDIITLPNNFGMLKSLKRLDISGGELSRTALIELPQGFPNLSNLEYLDLTYNQLQSLPDNFGNLKRLATLNLSHNNLASLPNSMKDLEMLHSLNAKENKITCIPDLTPNLKTLDVSHNRISELPDSVLSSANLETLDIDYNDIQEILFNNCSSQLRILNAKHNNITLDNKSHLPETLEILDLSENSITDLNPINNLKNLKKLLLKRNRLGNLASNFAASFPNLQELDLSGNAIQELPDIFLLPHLRELNLEGNDLTELPKDILNLNLLHTLNLRDNDIESLTVFNELPPLSKDNKNSGKLTNLRSLDLSGSPLSRCRLSEIPDSIGNLKSLEILKLSYTRIKELPSCLTTGDCAVQIEYVQTPMAKKQMRHRIYNAKKPVEDSADVLRWLHLTDLHFGRKDSQILHTSEMMLDYLSRITAGKKIDYIFITGDLFFGRRDKNDLAGIIDNICSFINRLSEILHIGRENLFIVPGNHDIKRVDDTKKNKIIEIKESGNLSHDVIEEIGAFIDYQTLRKEIYNNLLSNENQNLHYIINREKAIVVHLNTAATCIDSRSDFNLRIGNDGLFKSLFERISHNTNKPIIILGHHSLENIHSDDMKSLLEYVGKYSVRPLYLCGHYHKSHVNKSAPVIRDEIIEIICGTYDDYDENKGTDGTDLGIHIGELNLRSNTGSVENHRWSNRYGAWTRDCSFALNHHLDGDEPGIYRFNIWK